MASTPLLGLSLPADGTTNWGTLVNTSITALLDSAVAGTTTLSSDADVTLSATTEAANQARQAIILWKPLTGTVTRTITVTARSKTYVVINATGGTQSIVFRGDTPTTGVTIPAGKAYMLAWNGTDFVTTGVTTVNLATDVTGTLGVGNGGTGQTTATAAFNALAPSQSGQNGRYLKSDGTNASWDAIDIGTADITGVLPAANGGTGVNNGSSTITLAGSVTHAGAFTQVFTATGNTSVVLPTTGTLATTGNPEILTNKTISGASNTLSNIANASLTNSSITVNSTAISLGGSGTITAVNPNALTIGTGLSGTSYNGSSSATIAIDSTVVTLTGSQTLTNKTLSSPSLLNPALGTPSSGTLTNCGFLPINAGTTGTLPISRGGTGTTLSTGSGALVLMDSPTINSPALTNAALGTPVSGNFSSGTFTWPTFNQNTSGTAANIAGGAENRIPYNTGAGTTAFITAPTVTSTYLQWNGSAFTWAAAGGGGGAFELISTATISASVASYDITASATTYKSILIQVNNLYGTVTSATLRAQFLTTAGVLITGPTKVSIVSTNSTAVANAIATPGPIDLLAQIGNSSALPVNAEFNVLFNQGAGNAAGMANFSTSSVWAAAGYTGLLITTDGSKIGGLRLTFSSGNITAGTISVFGVK
jgi:hypothetical protein